MLQESLILTVSQLNQAIKFLIEKQFRSIQVKGEISNLRRQSSGHIYFSIKDTNSQISCVMFRLDTLQLKKLPKDGDEVIVSGEINVYLPRGNYQIVVRRIDYQGLGELLLQFQALKETLKARGWFDAKHKQALPSYPKKIGVITSPTGAVIQDILNVLNRRHESFSLLLNPVKVQGQGAALEIAQAIKQMNEHHLCDILIIGRGGGSIEDLWAFNEEIVAKQIFESKIPIITAIGHETDVTIADLVADLRAPTPSAAAEIVIQEKQALVEYLEDRHQALSQTLKHLLRQYQSRLQGVLKHPLFISPYYLLGMYCQSLDEKKQSLDRSIHKYLEFAFHKVESFSKQNAVLNPKNQIALKQKTLKEIQHGIQISFRRELSSQRQEINETHRLLNIAMDSTLRQRKQQFQRLIAHLASIDPKQLLKKGYSILFDEKKNSAIVSVKQLKKNQNLIIALADGNAKAQVNEININP